MQKGEKNNELVDLLTDYREVMRQRKIGVEI